MPLPILYALPASDTPAVRVASGYLDPNAADPTPVVSSPLVLGDTLALLTKFNALAVRVDNLGRYSGGGYAIAEGLAISEGTGLQAAIAAGVLLSDGHQTLAAQTKALTGSSTQYLWALRTGTIAAPVIASLAPPTATAVYLGRLVTDAGAVTAIDRSGVLEKRYGMLFRRTGDAGAPNDTPPASITLLTLTAGGLYLWDGVSHKAVSASIPLGNRVVRVAPAGGDYTTLSAALAAITTATLADPWLIVVSGSIAEAATLTAKSHVHVLFLPGAQVTITPPGATKGVVFTTPVNTTWAAADPSRPCLVGAGANYGGTALLYLDGCDSTVRLVGLNVDHQGTIGGGHGIELNGAANTCELREVTARASNVTTTHGLIAKGGSAHAPTARRCRFLSQLGTGLRLETTGGRWEYCEGQGGTGGVGIQARAYSTPELIACVGRGGSGSASEHGISVLDGAAVVLAECRGVGGSGGITCHGLNVTSGALAALQGGDYLGGVGGTQCKGAAVDVGGIIRAVGARFWGGGVGQPSSGSYAYAAATAKFRPHATRPYRVRGLRVVVAVATAGATVQFADALAGNNITGTVSLAAVATIEVPITSAVLIAGAAYVFTNIAGGAPADGSFTVQWIVEWSASVCEALLNDSVGASRLDNCAYASNCDSNAIRVTANGDDRSKFLGGVASAGPRDVGTRPKAMSCDAAWNPGQVFGMVLDGGSSGPLTAAAATAVNGTNTEI